MPIETRKVLTTAQLLPYIIHQELKKRIDPNGKHVLCGLATLHNDVEVRQAVLIKMVGTMTPYQTIVDIPLDVYNALGTETRNVK